MWTTKTIKSPHKRVQKSQKSKAVRCGRNRGYGAVTIVFFLWRAVGLRSGLGLGSGLGFGFEFGLGSGLGQGLGPAFRVRLRF